MDCSQVWYAKVSILLYYGFPLLWLKLYAYVSIHVCIFYIKCFIGRNLQDVKQGLFWLSQLCSKLIWNDFTGVQ